ncbi:hypothetical protein EOPP23_12590 [Endozoicomonas sp. OPT23]|uniref:DNA/RNA non-specific endonuclease n=1 Tax=Endozoicomonas sp. OPT23 TaxID=2072845 RepID=UPI00129B3E45|nr:DNA/RNA non-specific endonuclease [Endozoicomonas sp. OPT23]MRI33824.1 hypothetical protein [Endozoicomonas sp. OPT23]
MKFPVSLPSLMMVFFGFSNSVSSAPVNFEIPEAPLTNLTSAATFSCHNHVKTGIPAEADQYLCRDNYAVGFDYATKDPKWVSYYVTAEQLNQIVKREDDFKPDPNIKEEDQAALKDYENSGYDRGHMAPAGTIDTDSESMGQAFYLSNITPQLHAFNAGIWEALEEDVRDWATKYGEIYVVTGPVFKSKTAPQTIGDSVAVPDLFFKAVYIPSTGETRAYLFPHEDLSRDQLSSYEKSIDDVEQEAGITLFANKPGKSQVADFGKYLEDDSGLLK